MVLPLIPIVIGGAATVGVVFAIALSLDPDTKLSDQLEDTVTRIGWMSEGILRGAIISAPTAVIVMTIVWIILKLISQLTPTQIGSSTGGMA